ncbi:MAG: hypothetical protein WBA01_19725, partial [Phormidesmis sp.]
MPDLLIFLAAAGQSMLAEAEDGGVYLKNEYTALGLDDYGWVAAAMTVLLLIFVWQKVPGVLLGGL